MIAFCGCVQPIQTDSIESDPSPISKGSAIECVECYRLNLGLSLVEAAELAENGGTEKQVRDLIAKRNDEAQLRDLGPMLAPLKYEGQYSGQKTGAALRGIAAELGAK